MLSGRRMPAALELSEQAASLAEAQGWSEDPVVATACAVSASVLIWQGRFEEGEQYLDRGERTVRSEGEPATELIVHYTRGQLRLAQGRLEEALAAFRRAERVRARLVDADLPSIEPARGTALTLARLRDMAAARAAVDALPAANRDRVEVRAVAAAVALEDGDPEAAAGLLAGWTEEPQDHPRWVTVETSLVDAVAHDRLGDRRGAEDALERALDAAEADGILLPFLAMPVGDLLERHPRHRSAHATLLSDILDLRAGTAPPARGSAASQDDELSEAELRVLRYLPTNLKTSEIAAELFVSTNTVRTHVTHIYRKLDAHSRGEAVARGRELGLLARSPRR
jgi:LuxR family transcriptional regulator, maltose regulon positive regulatory protein